jgi:hypothetical protein
MTASVWPQMITCSRFRPQAGRVSDQSINTGTMFHTGFQSAGNTLHAFGARDSTDPGNNGARL